MYSVCMSLWMYSYRIVVIGCDSLSWEHKISVYAVQLSVGKLITRRLHDCDENVAMIKFLIRWKHIIDIRLKCNMLSITKDLPQSIYHFGIFL